MAEDDVSREELIEARANLQKQLDRVKRPLIFRGRSPQLVERLERMIAEIDQLLAEDESPN